MSKTITLTSLSAAAVLGISLLGGCAGSKDLEKKVQNAYDKATDAQACCDANTERLDRMFEKTMRK